MHRVQSGVIKIKLLFWLVLISLFPGQTLYAQIADVPINLPTYDHQHIHFGFLLGLNNTNFKVQLAPDLKIRDSVYVVESEGMSGLNLGILANLHLGDNFDLRFIPALSFAQRNLIYTFYYNDTTPGGTNIKKIESTYLEFPLDLKFKSERVNNYRVYVLAGFRYSIDMVSQAKVRQLDNEIVKLNRYDYGYEIGVGFDFYMTYFKFSPELKMYHGLHDLLVKDNTQFSNSLQSLFSKIFYVSFTFE